MNADKIKNEIDRINRINKIQPRNRFGFVVDVIL
jgi:hypothetical protein